ncbi:MAG: hypothetical protein HKN14_05330 [Marinicaulis sp.]|nr:hypothetical protein [Marinicaulis sp.]NNL88208.1 hypothetical protein [Marinicaulis sp.]
MKKNTRYFLSEGALIVFSILLALGANEWRQRAAAETKERKAAAAIHAELSANLALFEDLPEYHGDIAAALREEIAAIRASDAPDNRAPIDIFMRIETLRPTIIMKQFPEDVAWDLARQRGVAARFDYDLASGLSRAYSSQRDGVVPIIINISEIMNAPAMIEPGNQASALWPLASLFSELAAREITLISYYEQQLTALEIEYPDLVQESDEDDVIFTPVD